MNNKITVITSLYKGGNYIERFLNEITKSISFNERIELIIVDANSPEKEYRTIEKFQKKHSNIVYIREKDRIPIYVAWNIAIKKSTGSYITNANLDDLRRNDSFFIQAKYLDKYDFIDVVYQDFYYTFDYNLSYEEISKINIKSELPPISKSNILQFNSPHNAPMWRKKLHNEVGYFDESFKSAGDFDFWCRCLLKDKVFYKINDPHVIYFQNPNGLSTRNDGIGMNESITIMNKYGRDLYGKYIFMNTTSFLEYLNGLYTTESFKPKNLEKYFIIQEILEKF